jgi:hypothetical protein
MLGDTGEQLRRSHSQPAKPRSRTGGRWAPHPASRDLEIVKSTFAGEGACEACRLNKAAGAESNHPATLPRKVRIGGYNIRCRLAYCIGTSLQRNSILKLNAVATG